MSADGEGQIEVYRHNAAKMLEKLPPAPVSGVGDSRSERVRELTAKMTKDQLVNQMIILARTAAVGIETRQAGIDERDDIISRGKEMDQTHIERNKELRADVYAVEQKNSKLREENHRLTRELNDAADEITRLEALSEKRASRKLTRGVGSLWGKLDDLTQRP